MMTFGSLFAGIGGFDLGFENAGMRGLWQVEIDANCRQLLALRFPEAVQFADVREVGAQQLAPVDVITAGFPCQDLSVAGKRAGLKGARSGLFYEVTRIVSELQPRFLVWENVPGLLTSDKGRDFARVLAALGELGYFGAWRVLDARHFGVAQRRRRVFGVLARSDIGVECAAEILSLAEGLRGHPAPRCQTGQGVAGTLGSCSANGGRRSTDLDGHGAYIAGTLTVGAEGAYNGRDAEQGLLVAATITAITAKAAKAAKAAKGSGGPAGDECQNLVAHTLRGEGFDASEDGTGRGTPLVAFSCKDSGDDAGDLSPTLRSMNFAASHLNGGGQVAVAFQPRIGRNGRGQPEEICPTLSGANAGATSDMRPCVSGRSGVRRLTPRECERLQGFPDGWTEGFSDSVRYRMLGNAVAQPCAQWIGRRLNV
jgi:DNA (cytosine-5)-methyltransferase 1